MKKHKDYFMLPNKIFDLELKPRDFIVYSCLVRHKDNEVLNSLRGECVKEVKKTNGIFTFDEADDWQNGL